jgi:hypothetical protein
MNKRRWSVLGLTGGVVLALLLRVVMLWISSTHIPAFDDECKIALQAKQIARGEFSLLILASPYLFPLDAYLMAPIINLLPRNAFGARAMAFGFGLLTVLFSLLVLRRWGKWREVWPGALLVLFPSAYFLTLQSGVALPGYPTLMLLSTLVIWLTQSSSLVGPAVPAGRGPLPPSPSFGVTSGDRALPIIVFLAGLAAGLACSDTLLAVPVLLMGGLMVILRPTWRASVLSLIAYGIGAFLGFLPHLAAKYVYSGAFAEVSKSISIAAALKRIIQPALSYTLPSAFGFACPLFPDTIERISWMSGYEWMVAMGWLAVLLTATGSAGWDFIVKWQRDKRPSVSAGLFFVGVSWLGLGLYLDSNRSHFHTYRYLVPLVWSFPFLVAWLYRSVGRAGRVTLGLVAVIWGLANVGATLDLLQQWSRPGIADHLKSYDLKPVIQYLDQRGINRCHGTYADAYRLTYETDERIICSQPYNERFPGWLVPFKEKFVDPSTNVAYVLSDTYRFPPEAFEQDLQAMGVKYQKKTCGHYQVYTDFESPIPPAERGIKIRDLRSAASHHSATAANMVDGLTSFWRCEGYLQQTGMWVEVTWPEPRTIRRVKLDHGSWARDYADRMNVYLMTEGGWQKILDQVPGKPAPFDFKNQHPVYGHAVTEFRFTNQPSVAGIRFEIAVPRSRYAWTINEILVYADER